MYVHAHVHVQIYTCNTVEPRYTDTPEMQPSTVLRTYMYAHVHVQYIIVWSTQMLRDIDLYLFIGKM